MKGIILAGGSGTRLFPITKVISKQLMPIYDKPMIYYPLSILMRSGIKEILIITTADNLIHFKKLLGDGSDIGIKIQYIVQPSPDGLAQAFILGKSFIADDDVCLVLGDNVFHGHDLDSLLSNAIKDAKNKNLATIFGYYVNDPERYGVIEYDASGRVASIEEKPLKPKSNYAVTGLYFYPNDVIKNASKIKPSKRGELEITDLNKIYLDNNRLSLQIMGRGYAWLDTGTHENLLEASKFIELIERRQGLKVACIEEIAFEKGYISKDQIIMLAKRFINNQYGKYLLKRAKELS